MDKRTKDCYDEVMICHGVDNFNCKDCGSSFTVFGEGKGEGQ